MPRVVTFEGKTQSFPDDTTDAEISAALGAIPAENAKGVPKAKTWTGVAVAGGKVATDVASGMASELATNPNVPSAAAKVGRVLGGVAPIVGGAAKGGVGGAAIGMAGAAQGAWAGGKTGWFTGKLAQKLAGPVAAGLEAAAPLVAPLGYAPALQGDQTEQALGASVEEFRKLPQMEQVSRLMKNLGLPQSAAVRAVLNLRARGAF